MAGSRRTFVARCSTTIGKTLLDLILQVLRHDRLVLAVVRLALVSDPADIDWVRQNCRCGRG